MIKGLNHVAISTGNLQRALTFYCDLLGFEVVSDFSWDPGMELQDRIMALNGTGGRVVMIRRGGAMIEMFQFSSPPPKPGDPNRPVCDHGLTHFCLDVQDINAEYERLRRAGMVFHCPPINVGPGMWNTYGRDPDGNVIELQERPDR